MPYDAGPYEAEALDVPDFLGGRESARPARGRQASRPGGTGGGSRGARPDAAVPDRARASLQRLLQDLREARLGQDPAKDQALRASAAVTLDEAVRDLEAGGADEAAIAPLRALARELAEAGTIRTGPEDESLWDRLIQALIDFLERPARQAPRRAFWKRS
jgi:hypothetical protein